MPRKQLIRRLLPTWALLVAAALSPAEGRAEGIRLSGELTYQDQKEDTESKQTGEETDTDFSRFSQLYNIELEKQLFPYVDLRAGLLLDRNNGRLTTDDSRTKVTDRTRAYFFDLALNNPNYRAGLTYRDTEEELDGTNLPDMEIFRETYNAFVHWRPDALPSIDLNYRHSRAHDKPKTRKVKLDFLDLNSRYSYKNLALEYTYNRTDLKERIQNSGQLDILHDGSMAYATTLLGGRVSATGRSQLTYRTSDPSGRQSIQLQTSPPQGTYFLLDDSTPESNTPGEFTTVNAANPLTNVDIGPAGPPNLVSFGVEFPSPTRIDTVHVLPLEDSTDPSLASPAEIDAVADLFSWQVFSSDDQETWTELNVTRATYEVFENRFEISFLSPADVRFIKVATEPLSGGAPRSILIWQLQTFETVADSAGATIRSFRQNYSLGLRSELSADTSSFYDLYYQIEDLDPSGRRRTLLTNSIRFRHLFGQKLVGTTRYLRSISRKSGDDDDSVHNVQDSFVASLRADHLATFYQTLTYSAVYSHGDLGSSNTNTIWLRNSAELHPDWSASLDLGYARRSTPDEPTRYGPTVRFLSTLAPNRRMNFSLDYTFSLTKEKHERTRRQHKWHLSSFFVPTDTLSMVATFTYNDDGTDGHQLSQDYSVTWAPFLDGDLDFSLTYRRLEDRSDRKQESITPALRWQLRRGLLGILSYSIGSEESRTQKRDVNVFTAQLQFAFR
jgi:hypothetical protein